MSRGFLVALIGLSSFVAVLCLASLTMQAGLVANDTISLWAGAIVAGGGGIPIGRIVAAYPTLPFLATAALEVFVPAGAPTPSLLAAAIIAPLAALWFASFRAVGLSVIVSGFAAGLLALHPALLHAAIAGPSEALVAAILFLIANALFDLRARGAAPDVMMVALALPALAFSHPMGASIACAAAPFLAFAVRPALVENSAFNVVVMLLFPTVFAVGAFSYVSWVFPGSGWSFYSAPSQSLAAWTAGVNDLLGGGLCGIRAIDAMLGFALALTLGAPLAVYGVYSIRRRAPLVLPPMVLAMSSLAAVGISIASGWFGDPSVVAVVAPVLAAVTITRLPLARADVGRMLGLLALGWAGGALALVLVDPGAVAHFGGSRSSDDRERVAALDVGRATLGYEGVLADTDNAPALVVGRGSAVGLLAAGDEQFSLALLAGHLNAPFVAVPDPGSATGAGDRLDRSFPTLYRHGAPGYRLMFENAIWRVYGRAQDAGVEAGQRR